VTDGIWQDLIAKLSYEGLTPERIKFPRRDREKTCYDKQKYVTWKF
jgi:hypothetical protein